MRSKAILLLTQVFVSVELVNKLLFDDSQKEFAAHAKEAMA